MLVISLFIGNSRGLSEYLNVHYFLFFHGTEFVPYADISKIDH